jgi:hypothetical protein
LLFSFCAATGAHESWSETVLHFWPQTFRNASVLMWLVPAAFLGLNRLLTLNREMTDCRSSRSLLFTAAALYVIAGLLRLDVTLPVSEKAQHLLTTGATLFGHLALFMSLWVHARHVLHFTADPSAAPRRKLRIPRPHFRLPRFSFGWKRSAKGAEGSSEPAAEKPTRRRKPRKVAPKEVVIAEEVASPVVEEAPAPATPRRTFRVDARHAPPPRPPEPEPEIAEPQEEYREEPAASENDSNESKTGFTQEDQQDERQADVDTNRSEPRNEGYDDEDQDFGNEPRPDMRGMSKKQRRKILAELREKERAGRRK